MQRTFITPLKFVLLIIFACLHEIYFAIFLHSVVQTNFHSHFLLRVFHSFCVFVSFFLHLPSSLIQCIQDCLRNTNAITTTKRVHFTLYYTFYLLINCYCLQSERREQHFTPGRFTPIKLPEGPPLEGVAQLLDFPRHRLRLLEKLGEGDFGMVS